MQLAKGLRPVQPPAHVWQGIVKRLNMPDSSPAARPSRAWVSRLAIAASVLIVCGLAALLYWRSQQPGRVSEIATIAAPSGEALWQVEIYRTTGRLIVHTTHLPSRPTDRDYELWALPTGGTPVSLGVLPGGGTFQRNLSATQQQALAHTAKVAVTLEPLGGSPTGQPTSTPIFIASLRVVG